MKVRSFLSLIAASVIALAGTVSTTAFATDKVRVGVFPISSSLLYFVAIELAYLKEMDIEPETIRLMGGPQNVAALMTNQIDVSAVLVTLEGLNANVAQLRTLGRHVRASPTTRVCSAAPALGRQ